MGKPILSAALEDGASALRKSADALEGPGAPEWLPALYKAATGLEMASRAVAGAGMGSASTDEPEDAF
jgi:hypothetical protein